MGGFMGEPLSPTYIITPRVRSSDSSFPDPAQQRSPRCGHSSSRSGTSLRQPESTPGQRRAQGSLQMRQLAGLSQQYAPCFLVLDHHDCLSKCWPASGMLNALTKLGLI